MEVWYQGFNVCVLNGTEQRICHWLWGSSPAAGGTRFKWTLAPLCSDLVFFCTIASPWKEFHFRPFWEEFESSCLCLRFLPSLETSCDLETTGCECSLLFWGEILLFTRWKQWNTKYTNLLSASAPLACEGSLYSLDCSECWYKRRSGGKHLLQMCSSLCLWWRSSAGVQSTLQTPAAPRARH